MRATRFLSDIRVARRAIAIRAARYPDFVKNRQVNYRYRTYVSVTYHHESLVSMAGDTRGKLHRYLLAESAVALNSLSWGM